MSIEVRIVVRGGLEPRWSAWLDGATLTPGDDGTTVLLAHVADQVVLHGLVQRVAGLGLTLVSVTATER